MKFMTFKHEGISQVGVIREDLNEIIPVKGITGYEKCNSMIEFIEKMGVSGFDELRSAIENSGNILKIATKDVIFESPIPRPIHDVLCVGVNYKAHFEECQANMPMETPKSAVYFSKRSSKILSATDDIEHIQAFDTDFDYEVELAVIVGKEGKNIKAVDAKNYIFGYSVFNDLSARTLQKAHQQWYKGKGLDNTSVMGPYIIPSDEIAYPPELEIKCSVNGEIRQHSNTNMFIHDIGAIIEDLSRGCTLEPGDIIITGTPSGVGMGFNPPKYLKVGDIVECSIENVGTHYNKIV